MRSDRTQGGRAGPPAARVSRVVVRVGHLRQVVPDAMTFSWEMLTADTELEGAALEIEHVPADRRVRGLRDVTTGSTVPVMACGSCGSGDVELRTRRRAAPRVVRDDAPAGRSASALMGRFHRHADGTVHDHDTTTTSHEHRRHRDVGDHSGYIETGPARVEVLERILDENDRVAAANRDRLRAPRRPHRQPHVGARRGQDHPAQADAGPLVGTRRRIGVLEGDIATSLDADQLDGYGAAVALVNTSAGFGGECHLDAVMVRAGLDRLPLDDLDLLVVENVGNLVCPAEFDVGEDAKAMVYAVTEGEEKPLKYPVMFRAVEVVVRQQDRPPALPRRRRRPVPRQPAGRQPGGPGHRTPAPAPARASTSGAPGSSTGSRSRPERGQAGSA